MLSAQTFDVALPLLSGTIGSDGTFTDIQPAGTAFVPIDGVAVTCHHCVSNGEREYAVHYPSVGSRPERVVPLKDITPHPSGFDLASARVALNPRAPMRLASAPLGGFADVLTIGFPLTDRLREGESWLIESTARCLKGYVVRPYLNTRHVGYGPQPSYELDMPAPRGLSGAPLVLPAEDRLTIAGVVYGASDMYTITEESHLEVTTGTAAFEVRRYASFGLALDTTALKSLAGPATNGRPLGALM
jgi:hypothetical protein